MLIAVVPNQNKTENNELVRAVCNRLATSGANVRVVCSEKGLPTAAQLTEALTDCEKVIAIGGDGTIMHVAKVAGLLGLPVLGINGGRIGFLAGLEPDELDKLNRLLSGDYSVESRHLMAVTVHGATGDQTLLAMNDVVLSRGSLSRLIDVTVHSGEVEVLACRGDGVIVATPTGSTAYSLSAGGPVVDPTVQCLLLTPVCPHSLDSRSRVLPNDIVLTLQAGTADENPAFITIDGEQNVPLASADTVDVCLSDKAVHLIHLTDTHFCDILRNKLLDRR